RTTTNVASNACRCPRAGAACRLVPCPRPTLVRRATFLRVCAQSARDGRTRWSGRLRWICASRGDVPARAATTTGSCGRRLRNPGDHDLGTGIDGPPGVVDAAHLLPVGHAGIPQQLAVRPRRMAPMPRDDRHVLFGADAYLRVVVE